MIGHLQIGNPSSLPLTKGDVKKSILTGRRAGILEKFYSGTFLTATANNEKIESFSIT
jgi:hypothetical protein